MVSSNRSIQNFISHKATGKVDDSFVGIKVKNGEINFYYPESYELSDQSDIKSFRSDVMSILRSISLAKTLSVDKAHIETTLSENGEFALHSYLWIINDYLSNGIYVNREKVYKKNQRGKINWKRTLQNQPIISNGNIIYADLVVEIPHQTDNIIVEIHKFCVYKSIEYIGWLFGLSPQIIDISPFNENKRKIYLYMLKQELNNTFDDYKKLRLTHMLKVLQGVEGSEKEGFVYGVDTYYYVYEKMIDTILGNIDDIDKYYPKADWCLKKDGYKKTSSSKLRPDTIFISEEKKTIYIFDAKYYRFGTTAVNKDLPGSTSIQKQITYGEYIKENYLGPEVKFIRSAFILPYNKVNNLFGYKNDIEYIGFAEADWKDNTEEHQIIYAFLMDLKHTINTWNMEFSHSKDIKFLIQNIEFKVEKARL